MKRLNQSRLELRYAHHRHPQHSPTDRFPFSSPSEAFVIAVLTSMRSFAIIDKKEGQPGRGRHLFIIEKHLIRTSRSSTSLIFKFDIHSVWNVESCFEMACHPFVIIIALYNRKSFLSYSRGWRVLFDICFQNFYLSFRLHVSPQVGLPLGFDCPLHGPEVVLVLDNLVYPY